VVCGRGPSGVGLAAHPAGRFLFYAHIIRHLDDIIKAFTWYFYDLELQHLYRSKVAQETQSCLQ